MTALIMDESGSVIVIAAVSMTVLLAICALVVDMGMVNLSASKLQSAVDAAALAAAQELPDTYESTNTANEYIQLNGYSPGDIQVDFLDSNQKVKVTATKTIPYSFAKVLGFRDVTIVRAAAGLQEKIGGAFEYALFSGSKDATLQLAGSTFNIGGGIHSNQHFAMYCSTAYVSGACEAAGTITIYGSTVNVKNRLPGASVMDMPDFSATVLEKAKNAGKVYYGDVTYSTTEVNVNEAMYVYGNVTINTSRFEGVGTICATGSITFNGSSLNAATDDAVCFYSQSGNINVNGSSVTFDGILYAPKGGITINASYVNINGRVIGNRLAMNLSTLNITAGEKELQSLPTASCRLVQ